MAFFPIEIPRPQWNVSSPATLCYIPDLTLLKYYEMAVKVMDYVGLKIYDSPRNWLAMVESWEIVNEMERRTTPDVVS